MNGGFRRCQHSEDGVCKIDGYLGKKCFGYPEDCEDYEEEED